MPKIRNNQVLFRFFWAGRGMNMVQFLLIVVKLYSYKDIHVGNLQKIEYFINILDISVLFRPVMKYIYKELWGHFLF